MSNRCIYVDKLVIVEMFDTILFEMFPEIEEINWCEIVGFLKTLNLNFK